MSRTMIQAAVTMGQLQKQLDQVGHNMANSETTGYKARQSEFSSLLTQQINNLSDPENLTGRLTPNGVRVGSGARLGSTNSDLSVGTMKDTDRSLDVALNEKNQMFQIQAESNGVTETLYTRDGAFYAQPIPDSGNVVLVTSDGDPALGEDGPIIIEEGFDDIQISSNGDIMVKRNEQMVQTGSLAVVEMNRPDLLEATGNNAFKLPNLGELGYTMGDIVYGVNNDDMVKSGALEQANVDTGKEMTDMVNTQRSYQFNARTISMGDQMLGLINQLR